MDDEFVDALKLADKVYLLDFTSIDDKQDGVDININYLANIIPNAKILTKKGSAAEKYAKANKIQEYVDEMKTSIDGQIDDVEKTFSDKVTEVNECNPVFPKGMIEKNGPSITVNPYSFRLSFTSQRIISHNSYFIL